jgi:hypothetical protein
LPSLGKDTKNIAKTVRSKIYKVAMVTDNGGGDIQKVAKNVAEKSRRVGDFSQIGAPSQGKREGVDRGIVGDSETAQRRVRTTEDGSGGHPGEGRAGGHPSKDGAVPYSKGDGTQGV